jgi:hypothetical protein
MTAALAPMLLLIVSAAAPRVRISDSLSCPSASQLLEAIDQRLGPGRVVLSENGQDRTKQEVVHLEVFATEGSPPGAASPTAFSHFTVRLTSTSARLTAEQTLDAHRGSCVELARAVALLVESWLRDMPSERDLVPLTLPPEATPPAAASQRPFPTVVHHAPRQEARTHTPLLSLSGAMDAVVSTTAGLGGNVTLEVALPARFGVGARFSFLPSISGSDSLGGTVTVNRLSGTLIATYLLLPAETGLSMTLLAGVLALHDSATASGSLTQPSAATHWQVGGLVGVRGTLAVNKVFFVYGEADGQAVLHPLNFQVCETPGMGSTCLPPAVYTTVVTQPAWWFSLSLGVGARFL